MSTVTTAPKLLLVTYRVRGQNHRYLDTTFGFTSHQGDVAEFSCPELAKLAADRVRLTEAQKFAPTYTDPNAPYVVERAEWNNNEGHLAWDAARRVDLVAPRLSQLVGEYRVSWLKGGN